MDTKVVFGDTDGATYAGFQFHSGLIQEQLLKTKRNT